MPSLSELRARSRRLLVAARPGGGALESDVSGEPPAEFFTPFIPDHAARASQLAAEMMKAFAGAADPEAGLDAALTHLTGAAGSSELAKHALLMFVTHEPGARTLGLPSMFERLRRKYPDQRPMGYPFDRVFPDGIAATVDELECAAARDVTIRHRN